jgi:hypothetical protein
VRQNDRYIFWYRAHLIISFWAFEIGEKEGELNEGELNEGELNLNASKNEA